ncbi:MAG: phosphatidate cytidylyltransferase [Saprospiraceae bacterium]|nr:phosphatidate cytidylyltransferase [Saprospiraceae bacterium]
MTTQETHNKHNNGGLGLRAITATGFVLIMLGGVFLGAYPFVFLFGLIAIISLWEFACIVFPKEDTFHRISCVILGILPYFFLALYHLNCPGTCQPAILFSSMIAIFTLFTSELYAKSAEPFRNVGMVLLGVVYIGLPFMLLNLVAFETGTYEYKTVLGLMLMVWTNDTASYLLGKRFGSTPIDGKNIA